MISRIRLFLITILSVFVCISGCSSDSVKEEAPLRDNTPLVLVPEASGERVHSTDIVTLDVSNASKGYVMLSYLGTNEKTKLKIIAPDEAAYTYLVTDCSEPTPFPLSGGNGTYSFSIYESVDIEKDLYAVTFTQTEEVMIEDEFLPFLTPNVYVNYSSDSKVVATGVDLAQDCHSDLEVIENIYRYVTENIAYDSEKAQNVIFGYTPSPDATLSEGKGICFDYASLMTALLRSQQIPSRLEVGYAGETYHAWISCYVDEIGWVDNIIEFNGKEWSLMDPTLAANNSSETVQEYIGDGSNYLIKYTY